MSKHDRNSPSKMGAACLCPGMINAEQGRPDIQALMEHSVRGSAAHKLLEYIGHSGAEHLLDMKKLVIETGDERMPQWELVEEDISAVRQCVEYIESVTPEGAESYNENKVDPGPIIGAPDCAGTSDRMIVDRDRKFVEVIDYKNGGFPVEAWKNVQMIMYAIGQMPLLPDFGRDFDFRLTIVQPRAYHKDGAIRHYMCTGRELLDEWAPWLKESIDATYDINAPRIPGEYQCKFCKFSGVCPELAAECLSKAQTVFGKLDQANLQQITQDTTRPPEALTYDQVEVVLDAVPLIRTWLKAVENYGFTMVEHLPNWHLVRGNSSREYKVSEEDVAKTLRNKNKRDGKRITKSDIYVEKLLSPAQLEKKLKPIVPKKTWESIDSELVLHKQGGAVLAPITDSRPPITKPIEAVFKPLDTSGDLDFLYK